MQHQPPTRVRITCPDCGDVDTDTDHIGVVLDLATNAGSYVMRCPCCESSFIADLRDRETANRLITGGALYSTFG
jgi:ribosomal protein S27AE